MFQYCITALFTVLLIVNVINVYAASINISNTAIALKPGQAKTLTVKGTKNKITWTSSKVKVAAISAAGKVTARTAGSAVITASVSGKKLTCKVTVKKAVTVKGSTLAAQIPEPKYKMVGYYAAWSKYLGYTPDKIDAVKLTHINYAFANIGSDLKITLGYPDIDPANIRQLNDLKKTNPQLKTLISIGGWSWSGRFSDAALTEKSRGIFADSCISFMVKYGFDGIDIDWEYPVNGGLPDNKRRAEDKTNFTLLLKTLRSKLDTRGNSDKKHYLLTFAGASGSWYINNTQLAAILPYVDFANIMTYDIHGPWEQYTNFNAPLYDNNDMPPNQSKQSVDSGIKEWQQAGFPVNKIVMGVPFYGYIYKAAVNAGNGLYQTYSGGASISYQDLSANYLNQPGYIRYFHSDSKVPWLFNGSTFITYEDGQSMSAKAQYIKDKNLGGAMIWELSQDPNKVLLNALHTNLK